MAEEFEPQISIDVTEEREKPRLVSLLFCDYANKTAEGKHNILGSFDAIRLDPTQEIKSTPPFIVYLRLRNVPDGLLQLTIFAPSNDLAAALGLQMVHREVESKPTKRFEALIRMQFEIKEPGDYWMDVSYDGVSLGGESLRILFEPPQEE